MNNKKEFDTYYEFKRGIFFVKLSGRLEKSYCYSYMNDLKDLTEYIGFKKVVLDVNEISSVDDEGINHIKEYYNMINNSNGEIYFNDNNFILRKLNFNNKYTSISNNLDAFRI